MPTLLICIDDVSNLDIRQKYFDAVEKFMNARNHADKSNQDPCYDSGFDLYAPASLMTNDSCRQVVLDHEVSARVLADDGVTSLPYYMYPRSSISKTNLRLANSVGIIDAGYRGHLMAKLDKVQVHDILVNPDHAHCDIILGQRYMQICAHNLLPFDAVRIVSHDDLGSTARGSGGFGSTGV